MTLFKGTAIAAAQAALFVMSALAAPAMAQPAPEPTPEEAKIERQKNNAAKLAGLAGFVDQSCPDSKADRDRLRSVVTRLGIDPAALGEGDLLMRTKTYVEIYQKDVVANCARAVQSFGESGTTIPGLIGKR
ncbi:hypothetical protein [uncultured Methylobacterium sp.]|uniref:hypothetical protein n=1 Tax=uncultured Methylobacterium sp. TaxID=157278 RepID=UPI0035CB2D6D